MTFCHAYITVYGAYIPTNVLACLKLNCTLNNTKERIAFCFGKGGQRFSQFVLGSALYVDADLGCNISILIYMITLEINVQKAKLKL